VQLFLDQPLFGCSGKLQSNAYPYQKVIKVTSNKTFINFDLVLSRTGNGIGPFIFINNCVHLSFSNYRFISL